MGHNVTVLELLAIECGVGAGDFFVQRPPVGRHALEDGFESFERFEGQNLFEIVLCHVRLGWLVCHTSKRQRASVWQTPLQ